MASRPRLRYMSNTRLDVRVDHIGIAVESRDTLEPILELLGARVLADEPAEGYRWIYYELGDASRIELIEPVEEDTFLTDYLEKYGEGLHHITLEVADLDAIIEHLEENGVRVVDEAQHKKYREAFISPRSTGGTLIQLMEYEKGYVGEYGEPGVGDDLVIGGKPLSRE